MNRRKGVSRSTLSKAVANDTEAANLSVGITMDKEEDVPSLSEHCIRLKTRVEMAPLSLEIE